jgi:hypothetical protein
VIHRDFRALRGKGWGIITPSLAVAAVKHLRECPACRDDADAHNAKLSPCESAAAALVAVAMAARVNAAVKNDPEVTL